MQSPLQGKSRTQKKTEHRLVCHPDGALKGTIFAHKIARERQSLFGQKCELDSAHKCAEDKPMKEWSTKKDTTPIGVLSFLEAPPRFGLGVEVLQTFALPLGHGAIFT